jgi:hypothetical protein
MFPLSRKLVVEPVLEWLMVTDTVWGLLDENESELGEMVQVVAVGAPLQVRETSGVAPLSG